MNSKKISLTYSPVTGAYEIKYNGFSWVSDGRKPYIIIRKRLGGKYISTYRPLMSSLDKTVKSEGDSIICRYGGFVAFGKKLPFSLVCTASITGENTVEFSLKAENEEGYDIQAVYFPAPFNSKRGGKKSYHIDSMRQGFIMPDAYKRNFLSTLAYTHYPRKINTGDSYLPLWGRVCDGHGFSAIVETPYDACMFSSFGRRGAFVNSVHWRSSLGMLRYERKIRFTFHDNCDYNTVAKDYRRYLQEKGDLVTIDEKIKSNPNVSALIGAPVLHHGIFSNTHPKSKYYKNDGTDSMLYATFEERAEDLRKIYKAGLKKLYIHTDGWGVAGYDNRHPYVLPPCEQAGGYDGMKKLADTCGELGYTFGIHDQYRDFYFDCEKYDEALAVQCIDGSHPYCDIWAGGPHTWLCSSKALDFVKETYRQLEEHGVKIGGTYLDVFAVMPGDECFNEEHRVTREESIQYRRECFAYLRQKGIIVSSEEAAAMMLSSLDLVHHAPYSVRPQERGVAVGIPVPIANLVYHDCVFVPWISEGIGGWGIPDGDRGRLHCILNAQSPYFQPFTPDGKSLKNDAELKAEISNAEELSAINSRLYNKELLLHRFLDASMRRQQSVYSDGTVITVDFENETFDIKWSDKNE